MLSVHLIFKVFLPSLSPCIPSIHSSLLILLHFFLPQPSFSQSFHPSLLLTPSPLHPYLSFSLSIPPSPSLSILLHPSSLSFSILLPLLPSSSPSFSLSILLQGLRRRGYTASIVNAFCKDIGATRNANTVQYERLAAMYVTFHYTVKSLLIFWNFHPIYNLILHPYHETYAFFLIVVYNVLLLTSLLYFYFILIVKANFHFLFSFSPVLLLVRLYIIDFVLISNNQKANRLLTQCFSFHLILPFTSQNFFQFCKIYWSHFLSQIFLNITILSLYLYFHSFLSMFLFIKFFF